MIEDLRDAADRRPRVRVNQVGYLPGGPKRATLVTDAVQHLPFTIRTATGAVCFAGRTTPWPGPDPSSGLRVHVIDFSDLGACQGPVQVSVQDATSWPFRIDDRLYDPLFGDALRFFYAQRSGIEISDEVLPGYGRPAGHVGVPP